MNFCWKLFIEKNDIPLRQAFWLFLKSQSLFFSRIGISVNITIANIKSVNITIYIVGRIPQKKNTKTIVSVCLENRIKIILCVLFVYMSDGTDLQLKFDFELQFEKFSITNFFTLRFFARNPQRKIFLIFLFVEYV